MPRALPPVLSGPTFAAEVARGLPAAVTPQPPATKANAGRALAEGVGYRNLRVYWSTIPSAWNLAVRSRMCSPSPPVSSTARRLGASAHAALVTRGFAELRRFGDALGARPETLMGLSGLGDLLLTCGSPQSRNMSLGRALGQGQSIAEILGARRSVAEGVYTAAAVTRRARELGIEMPIAEAIHAIVEGRSSVNQEIEALMSRPLRAED